MNFSDQVTVRLIKKRLTTEKGSYSSYQRNQLAELQMDVTFWGQVFRWAAHLCWFAFIFSKKRAEKSLDDQEALVFLVSSGVV